MMQEMLHWKKRMAEKERETNNTQREIDKEGNISFLHQRERGQNTESNINEIGKSMHMESLISTKMDILSLSLVSSPVS